MSSNIEPNKTRVDDLVMPRDEEVPFWVGKIISANMAGVCIVKGILPSGLSWSVKIIPARELASVELALQDNVGSIKKFQFEPQMKS